MEWLFSFYGNEKGVWEFEAEIGYTSGVEWGSLRRELMSWLADLGSHSISDPPASASQIVENQFCNNVITQNSSAEVTRPFRGQIA